MQRSNKKPLIIIFAGLFTIMLILIVVTIYKYRNPPLSNINKYLGDASRILTVIVIEQNADKTIHLSDSVQIAEFCDIINKLSFDKDESIKNPAEAKYYLIITSPDYSIDTRLPKGHLFRNLKDKGIISPDFKVADMTLFDEWFKSVFEMEQE